MLIERLHIVTHGIPCMNKRIDSKTIKRGSCKYLKSSNRVSDRISEKVAEVVMETLCELTECFKRVLTIWRADIVSQSWRHGGVFTIGRASIFFRFRRSGVGSFPSDLLLPSWFSKDWNSFHSSRGSHPDHNGT